MDDRGEDQGAAGPCGIFDGMTPKEYADPLRLREAKGLPAEASEKVIDIAYQAGFSSLAAFNRFFKQQAGQAPTEYRKEHQTP